MRFAWFTPFSNKSAIGAVSKQVCEKMASGCHINIDIWANDRDDLIKTDLPVKMFDASDIDIRLLERYDYVVYNMGNYVLFHKDIYEVLRRFPGIVVLHDQTMIGFWTDVFKEDAAVYEEEREMLFGHLPLYQTNAFEIFMKNYDLQNIPNDTSLKPLVKNAIGVFSHAAFFVERLKNYTHLPATFSYLPCDSIKNALNSSLKLDEKIEKIIEQSRKEGRKIIVSTGIVHPVKHIDKVVEVLLANKKLRDNVCYIVIGFYAIQEYGEKFECYSKNQLKNCLYMAGYQPYESMFAALREADLCINLRHPNSEICSLSLLEQMAFGKPVLVLNSGIFGEVPENCVVRISLENEKEGIARELERLVEGGFGKTGENAGAFVDANCSLQQYSEKFAKFVERIDKERNVYTLQNECISSLKQKIDALFDDINILPSTLNNMIKSVDYLFNGGGGHIGSAVPSLNSKKVIGVWIAYSYFIPGLSREGFARFISYMSVTLIRKYDIRLEVWCYSFNENEVKIMFNEVLTDEKFENNIVIVTEKNWIEKFAVNQYIVDIIGEINERKNNLGVVANYCSKADIMAPMSLYLDNVLDCGNPVFLPAHDMIISDRFEFFYEGNVSYSIYKNAQERIENFARNNAFFLCNGYTVLNGQILKYVKRLKRENTAIVYLPINIPENILDRIMPEDEIRSKFNIHSQYLFYATKIRPNKNIPTLFKALNILVRKHHNLKLAITGDMEEDKTLACIKLFKELELEDYVVFTGNLNEEELYSLYRYAAATPVPSLFEGGFPWQACEALFMDTPIAISDIGTAVERIKICGFEKTACGFPVIPPEDENAWAAALDIILSDRERAVENQRYFKEKLLSYTWEDAAAEYYNIFFGGSR
jgi:glycosyltransferase involved in cell wall biosynthesis